jgi:type IV pilus assembly protein PilO
VAVNLRDPKTARVILILVGVAVVVYVYFLSSWFPWGYRAQAEEIRTLETHYQEVAREVTRAQMVARRLPLLQQEYALLSGHWEEAKKLLPDDREIISLLREVTIAGQSSGVDFVLVRPMSPVPRPYVTEHPWEVSVRGGFHQLGTFLGQMSGMDRVVTVSNLKVTGKNPSQEGVAMEASMITSAYTLGGLDPNQMDGSPETAVKGAVRSVKNRVQGTRTPSSVSEE